MSTYGLRLWPRTKDELFSETMHVFKEFNQYIKVKKLDSTDSVKIIMPITLIIRLKYVSESLKDESMIQQAIKLQDKYLLLVKKYHIINLIRIKLEEDIKTYHDWIQYLFSLKDSTEDLLEYDSILETRDNIHAELFILAILDNKIKHYINQLDKIDKEFREIGKKLHFSVLNAQSKCVFPEKTYWWWYLGGIID